MTHHKPKKTLLSLVTAVLNRNSHIAPANLTIESSLNHGATNLNHHLDLVYRPLCNNKKPIAKLPHPLVETQHDPKKITSYTLNVISNTAHTSMPNKALLVLYRSNDLANE